jgi:hypothetical protein
MPGFGALPAGVNRGQAFGHHPGKFRGGVHRGPYPNRMRWKRGRDPERKAPASRGACAPVRKDCWGSFRKMGPDGQRWTSKRSMPIDDCDDDFDTSAAVKNAQLSVVVREVPKVGLEPTHPCGYQILSLARLPFRHFGMVKWRTPRRPAEYKQSVIPQLVIRAKLVGFTCLCARILR